MAARKTQALGVFTQLWTMRVDPSTVGRVRDLTTDGQTRAGLIRELIKREHRERFGAGRREKKVSDL